MFCERGVTCVDWYVCAFDFLSFYIYFFNLLCLISFSLLFFSFTVLHIYMCTNIAYTCSRTYEGGDISAEVHLSDLWGRGTGVWIPGASH